MNVGDDDEKEEGNKEREERRGRKRTGTEEAEGYSMSSMGERESQLPKRERG